ncbi:DNA transposition protein [Alloalcanivorax xenomutans]|uniref:AAA family ATPase n=1 Tax=Alloalcanivorax xenomutans TaxID=1094342 RepID=UPI0006D5BEB1|nr:ATP-binding protein [Alloalcanivorax xenomutans]CUR45518.1 DNA transposition protein [Alloalcanivorax xenomutans]
MMQQSQTVNSPTVAPLRNVALADGVMRELIERPAHLPGMAAFFGPSGYGKTIAASFVATSYRAYYVECKSTWTKKAILLAILKEMGVVPMPTIYQMVDQIAEQLMLSQRPLLIDEMDHIVEKKAVELIRDIYEISNTPILMVGEEHFPAKLKRWERFHNRMLVWQQAQPSDLSDARELAHLYVTEPDGIEIADDLLDEVLRQSRGAARRIVVNLELIRKQALRRGWTAVDLSTWGSGQLYTGDAPARRTMV